MAFNYEADSRWLAERLKFSRQSQLRLFHCVLLCRATGTGSGFDGADTTSTWCGLDTGDATITDRDGSPRSVFVSVRRDGSVWLRFGRDHASLEWVYVDEPRTRLHSVILSQDDIHVLQVC